MKQLVETMVKSIVDVENKVMVDEVEAKVGNSVIISILVDKSDLGKVIGKSGKTISSLRNIVYAASFKTKRRYTIEVNAHQNK